MYNTKAEIVKVLRADDTLVNLLASNLPFSNPLGNTSKENSIVPFNFADGRLKTPFITYQGIGEDLIGENLLLESFAIRVYNSPDKSYETIRQIQNRIKYLLHKTQLPLADGVNIMVKYSGSGNEAVDEPINLNFQESRYQAQNL
jgi:hypothetical protein